MAIAINAIDGRGPSNEMRRQLQHEFIIEREYVCLMVNRPV